MNKFAFLLLIIGVQALILQSCGEGGETVGGSDQQPGDGELRQYKINGNAQGTTYYITYFTDREVNMKPEVDRLLHQIDNSLSSWVPTSLLSKMNTQDTQAVVIHDTHNYVTQNFKKAREVYVQTEGAFDPTVGPIVNLYGFGVDDFEGVDNEQVEDKRRLVGFEFDRIRLTQYDSSDSPGPVRLFYRSEPQIQLDFNGIAQGFSVDEIRNLFLENDIQDFMIELGGEIITGGQKPDGESWVIGIDKPVSKEEERQLQIALKLDNKAVATSGSYRKYIEQNGEKFSHTIDPKTGFPVRHNLISVTVVSDLCIDADAYGTAFLVMGTEKTQQFLKENPDLGLEAFLIYDEDGEFKTWHSEGLTDLIQNVD